ncbi:MAG: AI-2E family transporter [Ardenticatenaceae bacterium]|nr:AI-2E family transporter [Ardenticatenaceae bacterium]HBY92724.1 hypothetical protein [Chloroflexota bacterium]
MNGRHTFYKTIIILATLVAVYLLYRLSETIIVLFAAIIFASAIRPFVDVLERRGLNRGLAILTIYIFIIGAVAGLLVVAVPPLIGLGMELFSNGKFLEMGRRFALQLASFGWDRFHLPIAFTLPAKFQALIGEAGDTASRQAWPLALGTGVAVTQIFLALVMAFYWLTARPLILDLLLRMSPVRHRERLELIWTDIEETLGAFVRGQVILVLAIGAAAFAGLLILRVPYPLALAVVAGLTEAIPMIGPFLGAIPAVLVGFMVSPTTGLLVAGWYLLIQELEGHVLVPKVMEKSVGLNPLVVIIALIAGGTLNGIVGALLAIPVAGALQVVARHLLIEPAIQNNAPRTELGIVLFDDEEPEETAIVTPANGNS